MKWFVKNIFDEGGKDLKNHSKSNDYFNNILKKFINFKKKLTFLAYDRIGGKGSSAGCGCSDVRFSSQKLDFRAKCDIWIQLFWKIFRENGTPTQKKGFGFVKFCDFLHQFRSRFFQKITCFLILRREEELLNSKGVILIEFAVCTPILIILLFYINDLVKIKRYYSQTEFVAQQMANIIQNISQKRTNKQITQKDLHYISAVANLSIYPGKTMFYNQSSLHYPQTFVHCIKGLSGGKATKLWYVQTYSNYSDQTSPSGLRGNAYNGDNNSWTTIRGTQNVAVSKIHPFLKINEGEIKIIVESFLHVHSGDEKKAFGLHFVKPKQYSDARTYFPSVAIFTPKPGLFTENVPPDN